MSLILNLLNLPKKKPRGNVEDGLFSALNEATESEVVENLDGDESDREKFGGEEQ